MYRFGEDNCRRKRFPFDMEKGAKEVFATDVHIINHNVIRYSQYRRLPSIDGDKFIHVSFALPVK